MLLGWRRLSEETGNYIFWIKFIIKGNGKTEYKWRQLWGVSRRERRGAERLTGQKGQGLPTDGQLCTQPVTVETCTLLHTSTHSHTSAHIGWMFTITPAVHRVRRAAKDHLCNALCVVWDTSVKQSGAGPDSHDNTPVLHCDHGQQNLNENVEREFDKLKRKKMSICETNTKQRFNM